MKRNFFSVMLCLLFSNLSFAQWTTSGTNIYNSNTGKVGIGNTAPTTLFDVGNTTKSTVAQTSVLGGYPDAYVLGVQSRTSTADATMSSRYAGNMFYTARTNSAGVPTGAVTGFSNWVNTSHSSASLFELSGIRNVVEHVGNGTISGIKGIITDAKITSTGTMGNYTGIYYSGSMSGGGTITNAIGIYLNNVTGNVTNNYGIYSNCSKNYFDGTVGIGTLNNGSFKLAVDGKIGAREVQVTATNPFPDYVFEKDYGLMNLDNLDQYIQVNKHLPNIPSAKEVKEAGGVELGKMNIKLVEKVEELTLYIIDLNKRLKQIEEENELLKNNKIK